MAELIDEFGKKFDELKDGKKKIEETLAEVLRLLVYYFGKKAKNYKKSEVFPYSLYEAEDKYIHHILAVVVRNKRNVKKDLTKDIRGIIKDIKDPLAQEFAIKKITGLFQSFRNRGDNF